MTEDDLKKPQWTTSSRLLKLGEQIRFRFHLPFGVEHKDLEIFPRYLERANPDHQFVAGGNLQWLESLESEKVRLGFHGGSASLDYQPEEGGSYLIRWRAGGEELYRYFSVIEDDWTVIRFSPFMEPAPEPTLHATGIPMDYLLPVGNLRQDDPLFRKLLSHHRCFGDTVILHLPDTPDLGMDQRVQAYGEALDELRSLLPDANDARSARVEMNHERDPGYTEALAKLGVNDHDGLVSANARPWLGMPEFPYFSSIQDCRKADLAHGGEVVAHQWDFCGSWHFLGPVAWHYAASEGNWEKTEKCLRSGLEEARNLVEMNNHPAFFLPLYNGAVRYKGYPNRRFVDGWDGEPQFQFVQRYQRAFAFEFTKEFKLAFARSIDIADYYRRHFAETPRTVFVSRTDHLLYDMWWLNAWYHERRLVTRERIPWETRISTIMKNRSTNPYWKDPLSREYIVIEDTKRSIRFERECPNPIWWFDYTSVDRGSGGSSISHVETPDVEVIRSFNRNESGMTIILKMETTSEFPNYAIALWGLPAPFDVDPSCIETNAKELIYAKNTDGERHMVLFFDLVPGAEIHVTVRDP